MSPTTITCACGQQARRVTGADLYPHRPDLARKHFFRCDCGSYVGCHKDTWHPLGTPADEATRRARSMAHAAFDPTWRGARAIFGSRGSAYAWLRNALGSLEPVHIGTMDVATAKRVADVVRDLRRSSPATTGAP